MVPFRYCKPLRAEAIAMIGFALTSNAQPIITTLSSLLIPTLPNEIKILDSLDLLGKTSNKMQLVELLWLLANIISSSNERLKYEFVNLGLHERL